MKTITTIAIAVLITIGTASGQTAWGDRFRYERDTKDLFAHEELTLDLFAAYGDPKSNFKDTFRDSLRGGEWGAGVGLNYFMTRFFGVGVDAFGLDNDLELVDAANVSAILRLPIDEAHLAPYAFGGGGFNFHGNDSWTAHVGAGLELRLNPHTGIFVDGRHVFAENSNVSDYLLVRTGLRFAF